MDPGFSAASACTPCSRPSGRRPVGDVGHARPLRPHRDGRGLLRRRAAVLHPRGRRARADRSRSRGEPATTTPPVAVEGRPDHRGRRRPHGSPGSRIEVVHTPGHTPGSVCFRTDGWVLSGDLVFAGRDRPKRLPELVDAGRCSASLRRFLDAARTSCTVFPGHGPRTTVGRERVSQPVPRGAVRWTLVAAARDRWTCCRPTSKRMRARVQDRARRARRAATATATWRRPAFEAHRRSSRARPAKPATSCQKEMYTFADKRRALARAAARGDGAGDPGRTSPVRPGLRSPFKGYYVEPMWRYGRPQKGRLREFRQFGVEVLGTERTGRRRGNRSRSATSYLRADGSARGPARGQQSIGDERRADPPIETELVAYLQANRGRLRDEHRERFADNPLRVLDCKDDACREVAPTAPTITRPPLRGLSRALRARAGAASTAPSVESSGRRRARPGPRLLHADRIRVRERVLSQAQATSRRRGPLRRAWRKLLGLPATPGRRLRRSGWSGS